MATKRQEIQSARRQHPVTMQIGRGVFLHPLSARAVRAGPKKKAANRGLYYFVGRQPTHGLKVTGSPNL
jgi:hypothetical protein